MKTHNAEIVNSTRGGLSTAIFFLITFLLIILFNLYNNIVNLKQAILCYKNRANYALNESYANNTDGVRDELKGIVMGFCELDIKTENIELSY